jgi:hypothetical protein
MKKSVIPGIAQMIVSVDSVTGVNAADPVDRAFEFVKYRSLHLLITIVRHLKARHVISILVQ